MIQSDLNTQQNKFNLYFLDTNLEHAFRQDHARQMIPQIRKALLIAAALYALFTALDFIVVPEGQWATLLVRFVIAIPTFLLGYYATYRPFFRKRIQVVIAFVILIAGIGLAFIALLYGELKTDLYLAGTLLPIFWAFIYSGLRFDNAVKVVLILLFVFNIIFLFASNLTQTTLVIYNFFLICSIIIGMLGGYTIEQYFRRDYINQKQLKLEKRENENLLLNILPAHIAKELKETSGTIAKDYEKITVLFTDLVGFSELSTHHSAIEVVSILNEIFSRFDALTDKFKLEKIKTIGDAYMVTSSLTNDGDNLAVNVAEFALAVRKTLNEYNEMSGHNIKIRTGMHTGEAVAGVIGVKKFVYDVWGNTVNIASRMESKCPVGAIQVSEQCYQNLLNDFNFEPRGLIKVKGFHDMNTFLLLDKKAS